MTVNVNMWLRRPTAMLLKPAYPGATITDAAFLGDGRLALSMANPAESTGSGKRALDEAWIYDPVRSSLVQFTTQGQSTQRCYRNVQFHRVCFKKPANRPFDALVLAAGCHDLHPPLIKDHSSSARGLEFLKR